MERLEYPSENTERAKVLSSRVEEDETSITLYIEFNLEPSPVEIKDLYKPGGAINIELVRKGFIAADDRGTAIKPLKLHKVFGELNERDNYEGVFKFEVLENE